MQNKSEYKYFYKTQPILTMQSHFQQPKFDRYNSFTTLNKLSQNPQMPQQYMHHKDPSMRPTEQSQLQVETERFPTRSNKKVADDLGISFQEPFMEEHKQCLLNQLRKYVESQDKLGFGEDLQSISNQIIHPQQSFSQEVTLKQIFKVYGSLLAQKQCQQLIIDLKREDKLQEFLQLILKNTGTQVGSEFVFILNAIYDQYLCQQDQDQVYQDVIEYAQSAAQKIVEKIDKQLKILNYRCIKGSGKKQTSGSDSSDQKQRAKQFKKFIIFLSTTLMLIASGYFQNPYYEMTSNYYKRQSENPYLNSFSNDNQYKEQQDQDSSLDYFGSKKMKY